MTNTTNQTDSSATGGELPKGYFMRHKTGTDIGFSWKYDDPLFSDQWERILVGPIAPQAATPLPGQRIDRRESIADNADAMIILTQNYPREDKIRIVDAHTERNVRAALTQQAEPEPEPSYWMSVQHGEFKVSYTDDSDTAYKWFPVWTHPIAPQAAPKAPASEQQAGATVPHELAHQTGDGDASIAYVNGWNDCRDTMLGRIHDDPANRPAATTASASRNHTLATDELWAQMDEYTQGLPDADQLVLGRFWNWLKARAPAPSREAAPLDEHVAFNRWFHASGFTKYMDSMFAAWEARAAIAQQGASQAPASEKGEGNAQG